jgi:hypothetical protein
MSCLGFSCLILHWMPDFSLAPRLRCASTQEQSPPTTFLPHFWLVLAGFLDIQLIYTHLQDDEFHRVVKLKFQITGYIC